MKVIFDENMVLHICPKDDIEAMALKYWYKEFQTHGLKLLEIEPNTKMYKEHKLKEKGKLGAGIEY